MIITPRIKNVIVTGGGSGIGYSIASRLIREGCKVCICGRTLAKLEAAGAKINSDNLFTVLHDITRINEIDGFIARCEELMGGVDGLVNSAGISTRSVGTPGMAETELCWDSVMDTNLKALIFMTRKFVKHLEKNGRSGNVVNISSAQGNAIRTVSAYQMAKSSVIKFTRGIAYAYAKYGIIVNGIAPGCTYSEMTKRPAGGSGINKLHANQRTLEPEEIADICVFLMSEQGQAIVGDTIFADGGFMGAV